MSYLMRKCVVNLKNVNRWSSVCVVMRNERQRSQSACILKREITNATISHRTFHTSSILNKSVAFKLSDIGEGIREVVIKEWFVKVGDKVQQFDNICEVQSDKAAVTITSRYDGVVKRLYHEVDQTALVGQPLVDIEVEDGEDEGSSSSSDEEQAQVSTKQAADEKAQKVKVLTTPSVRRIAAQFNVDLSTVKPTGKNGRILKEDMLAHLNIDSDASNIVPDATTVKAVEIPVTKAQAKVEVLLEDRVVPVSGFTKAMVKSMTEAMKIPHFGYSEEYDVTKLVEARDLLKTIALERGVKFSYMPIIIKATSLGLTQLPILNSSLDSNCEHIIYKANHNIGVAMDTPNGLVVPVIKNVQNKTILEIASELNSLQEKGTKGQLGLAEISGGTFTLSNIGIIGGTYTKPVILPPQVAIGALGKIQVLPRFDSESNIRKAHILTISFSADHRVIDGVTMARFSNYLKNYLENPTTLLLDL
ncbi:lipoamide acyltransferase component of branched-chain alpha-keto acid dehydrogenase complex, mitochondrial [Trichoplusia ni]|uniref:Dihydrolipoamide acetyltransferase component of pyruvate dehydrogenase complex n=1 Tax=Trichoplusia ni TaxID=7111 RepID=A0A7E5VLY7_TRINI|nr:lipoamide acyltransferase component of branched-chain alpha-keto acid dehydrogenase complex, mitochondrial [Trichoplusia ni]